MIKWISAAGVLLGLAMPAVAAPAAPAQAAGAVDPAAKQAALTLAQMLFPEDAQLRMADRMVSETIGPAFRQDENFAILEEEYPGIIDAMIAEMAPLLRSYVKRGLPDYYERASDLYAQRLTADEIADLTAFYRSPTGRKLAAAMADNYRLDATIDEIVENPDAEASLEAVTKDHQSMVARVKETVDESDAEALIALGKKPYASKVLALGADLRQLEHQMMNEPDPEFDAMVEKVFEKVLARFENAAGQSAPSN